MAKAAIKQDKKLVERIVVDEVLGDMEVTLTLTIKEALMIKALLGPTHGDTCYSPYHELNKLFPDSPTNTDQGNTGEFEKSSRFLQAVKQYS